MDGGALIQNGSVRAGFAARESEVLGPVDGQDPPPPL
jgi:hypothetical protein